MESIIKKYLEGKASDKETLTLIRWLDNEESLREFKNVISNWKTGFSEDNASSYTLHELDKFKTKILKYREVKIKRLNLLQSVYKYAAVILLFLAIGSLFLYISGNIDQHPVYYNTIMAENGQISKAILPDSTVVWLNSGSSIKYNNQFSINHRDVILSGQAYFDVTKNKNTPFIVSCDDINIKVLGTQFSAENYTDNSDINVILVEGSVELLPKNSNKSFARLNPNEMMVYNKSDKKYSINTVVTKQYTSWREGVIYIYDQPLKDVLPQLQKRYNQQIVLDKYLEDYKVTFSIRNEDFLDFLDMIQNIVPVNVYQEGGIIYLKKK